MLRPPGHCHGRHDLADAYDDPEPEDGHECGAYSLGHGGGGDIVTAGKSHRRKDGGSFQ